MTLGPRGFFSVRAEMREHLPCPDKDLKYHSAVGAVGQGNNDVCVFGFSDPQAMPHGGSSLTEKVVVRRKCDPPHSLTWRKDQMSSEQEQITW
jgi:hypothetical protein